MANYQDIYCSEILQWIKKYFEQYTNRDIGLRELRRLVLPVNSVSDTVLH